MVLSNKKLRKKRKPHWILRLMVFVFPSHMNSDFLEMAEHLSVHGKWWMFSLFYFSLLIKLSLSQPISFLTFTLVIFSTIPVWRKWENLYGAWWLQLNHYKLFKKMEENSSLTLSFSATGSREPEIWKSIILFKQILNI